jgi:8-oxo-dGTP diphosphatase
MVDKLFVATKAFIVHEGKVLMVRESAVYEEGTNKGQFDFPGGRLNPGEKCEEALKREVREEVGIDIEIEKPFYVDEWRPVVAGESWQVIGIFYLCSVMTDEITLGNDHSEYIWLDPKEYASIPIISMYKRTFDVYLGVN